ncbi:MAG TPA: hypothetical protein VMT87_16880 [Vicinamibacteria bacterium]|nr:hypothetical protein [Vicinamibacteria bacterium]
MSVSEPIPMVRCRLDGPQDVPERHLRYVPLAEFELWKHLMETRHHRVVAVEQVSIWVPEDAARWNSGYVAEDLEPVLRLRFQRPGPQGTVLTLERFFPAETYPEAQEALLGHVENASCRRLSATPGYFVPLHVRAAEPAAAHA